MAPKIKSAQSYFFFRVDFNATRRSLESLNGPSILPFRIALSASASFFCHSFVQNQLSSNRILMFFLHCENSSYSLFGITIKSSLASLFGIENVGMIPL